MRFSGRDETEEAIMANDRYNSFEALTLHERLNTDYRILIGDVGSDISIIAPHGGKIEPKTSNIARMIAGRKYNCYCFEGIKAENNRTLHITSHRFDEPIAVNLITASRIVVAVHACTEQSGRVYLGGRDATLKKSIARELNARGIDISMDHPRFLGLKPDNICNQGQRQKGVQLEVSRDLRDDPSKVQVISEAVKVSLAKAAAFMSEI